MVLFLVGFLLPVGLLDPHAMINMFKRCVDEKNPSFPVIKFQLPYSLKNDTPQGWKNFGRGAMLVHISLLADVAVGAREGKVVPNFDENWRLPQSVKACKSLSETLDRFIETGD